MQRTNWIVIHLTMNPLAIYSLSQLEEVVDMVTSEYPRWLSSGIGSH
jgi:hypothetical protein